MRRQDGWSRRLDAVEAAIRESEREQKRARYRHLQADLERVAAEFGQTTDEVIDGMEAMEARIVGKRHQGMSPEDILDVDFGLRSDHKRYAEIREWVVAILEEHPA